jgi:hypothetical protein
MMTVPALILGSLLALVALPVFAQITGGSDSANRSAGVHGPIDAGAQSENHASRDDSERGR